MRDSVSKERSREWQGGLPTPHVLLWHPQVWTHTGINTHTPHWHAHIHTQETSIASEEIDVKSHHCEHFPEHSPRLTCIDECTEGIYVSMVHYGICCYFFNLPLKSDTHWAIWYTLHNLSFYVGLSLITTCVPEHSHASEFTGFSMLISLILNMVFSYTYIYPTEYVRSSMTYQT